MSRIALGFLAASVVVASPGWAADSDLGGTWALHYDIVTKSKIPVVGSLKATSRTSVLVHLSRDDSGWLQEHKVCGSALKGGFVKSRVPDTYTRSIPRKRYRPRVWEVEGELHYRADTGVFTAGFDASCAAVPEDLHDPCAIDWDGDGLPGATIQAKAPLFPWVDVYVSQRNHIVLDGQLASSDRLEGLVSVQELVTHVLGASQPAFARSPESTVVAEETRFVMIRLGSDARCADVLAVAPE
ncbi:MAG: hypothetical protein KC912_15520 [Proteobacteria bacterium]|nr:hypothetical protein [Pseudomonadota bacterium]